ncbi:MAG: DUF1772 domain-containing protein [Alphaproteobacteria bacterium]|nr:DUF1772 domain-containing protein [Alphaproteobacteria bacterium]
MIDDVHVVLLFAGALGSGLIAGVFFAFSSFVMVALGRLPAAQGIAAMQSINIVVINRWFLGALLGTAAISLALLALSLARWGDGAAVWGLAGSVLYLVGTIGVTRRFNIPLNDALAAVEPASAEGAAVWARYLVEWTNWNTLRTVAPLAAGASYILALR